MWKWALLPVLVVAIWLIANQKVALLAPESSITHQSQSLTSSNNDAPIAVNDNEQTSALDIQSIKRNSSIKGTQIDGAYPVDSDGHLIMSDRIRHRFEYFLSTMGEFTLDEIIALIEEDIRFNLQQPAQQEALTLLKNYIDYKRALIEVEQAVGAPQSYEIQDIESMRQRLLAMQSIRREHLSDEAIHAFFGFDESYDAYMLSRLEIINNNQLTEKEKQQQIESLQNSLPQEVRELHKDTQHISRVYQETEELRAQGASDDEIFQHNSQEFGQEAAIRLQQVEQTRAQFTRKVDAYLQQRQRILQDKSLSSTQQSEAISELKSDFDDNEKARLRAYELMADESNQ